MRENLKGLCLFKKHIKYLVVQRVNSAWNFLYTLRNCLHKKFQCKLKKNLAILHLEALLFYIICT